jgi:UrcA family protein
MLMRSSPIVLAVALLTASLSPASAEEVDYSNNVVVYSGINTLVRTKVVPYGDLNVTSRAGETALQIRVAAAVDKVCGGPSIYLRDLIESGDLRACQARSMADAMSQVQAVVDRARQVASVPSAIRYIPTDK